jgi:hypothetical protein
MRFLLITTFLIISTCLSALEFGVQYDSIRRFQIGNDEYHINHYLVHASYDYDKSGPAFFLEAPIKLGQYFETGIGMQYQILRSYYLKSNNVSTNNNWGDANYAPIYITNRITIPYNKDTSIKLIGNIGYSYYLGYLPWGDAKVKNDLFTGLGMEVSHKHFFVRCIFETSKGTIRSDRQTYWRPPDEQLINEKIGLAIGYILYKDKK